MLPLPDGTVVYSQAKVVLCSCSTCLPHTEASATTTTTSPRAGELAIRLRRGLHGMLSLPHDQVVCGEAQLVLCSCATRMSDSGTATNDIAAV